MMQYRSLGRTGVKVSPLCLGCMNFGSRTGDDEGVAIIHRALDAGINFLDTANAYRQGASERVVGRALAESGKRHRVVLATKVWATMDETDPNARGPSRRHILHECDASLQRLRTDHLDLYQIHKPSHDVPIDETLRALDDLVRAGKVRYIGTTTFPAWRVMEALWVSKELGLNRFVCEQPLYHLLDRRIERELVPMAQTYGLGLIPWSPLASGFLTGKYAGGQTPEGSRIGPKNHRYPMMVTNPAAQKVVEVLGEIGKEKGATVAQVALAWNLNQPGITAPIIGPRTMEHLEDNLKALEVTLSDEDRRRIDEVSPPGRALVPYYDADWAASTHRW